MCKCVGRARARARSEQDPVSKPLHLPALQVWYEERTPSNWTLPSPAKRCDYVVAEVRKRNKNYSRALLQATRPGVRSHTGRVPTF